MKKIKTLFYLLYCISIQLQSYVYAQELFESPDVTPLVESRADVSQDSLILVNGLSEGGATRSQGEIYFIRPEPGTKLKSNAFGQYRGNKPEPAQWTIEVGSEKTLDKNSQVAQGDIIKTTKDGFIKLLLQDESVLDIGPNSLLKLQSIGSRKESGDETVRIQLVYGKVRVVTSKPMKSSEQFELATPSAVVRVRKEPRNTDFTVFSELHKEYVSNKTASTEVAVVHGQVTVDLARLTTKGTVYYHPVVVNPLHVFQTKGPHGLGLTHSTQRLSREAFEGALAHSHPKVNILGTAAGKAPQPELLEGSAYTLDPGQPIEFAPGILSQNFPGPQNLYLAFPFEERVSEPIAPIPSDDLRDSYVFTSGLGISLLEYHQTNKTDFFQSSLEGKFSFSYQLTHQWNLNLSSFITMLPIKSSISEYRLGVLGLNFRVGYLLPFLEEPWSFSVLSGLYYTTMFATNREFGLQHFIGPQLVFTLRYRLKSQSSIFGFFKYSPLVQVSQYDDIPELRSPSLDKRELSIGFGWNKYLKNEHVFGLNLDMRELIIQWANQSQIIESQSIVVSANYGI